jgi:hypothetical protein
MMLRETTPDAAARREDARRITYRSEDELKMRVAVETWGRAKWPKARVVHELVMDRGTVRADVAFISPNYLVAVEIKSEWDDTSRLLCQAGMFRLAASEVWLASPHRHIKDCEMIRYLMPSIGVALSDIDRDIGKLPDNFKIETVHDAAPFSPYPEATLCLLWVAELRAEAQHAGLIQGGKPPTHSKLVGMMLKLPVEDQIAAVCRQLRAREAFWRSDPPVNDAALKSPAIQGEK